MAGTAPRLPEQFRTAAHPIDFTVSELASDAAGAHSPYGDTVLPMPFAQLRYQHPTAAERPRLAGGR
jgi:hypothetical protein